MNSQPIHDAISARKCTPEAVLEWIGPDMDVIVGLANAEPVHTIDAIEAAAAAAGVHGVRLHQMMPMRPRRYIEGELPGLRHVGWFLSPHSRAAFRRGNCDLVPNSLGSEYMSSSGGQPDYARGAVMAEHGQAFIVLHSSTADDTVSRIVPQLHPGAAVTTFKNIVDKVVTEYGVAELRGSSIAERTRRLIAIAHPNFRDELTARARELCYLM